MRLDTQAAQYGKRFKITIVSISQLQQDLILKNYKFHKAVALSVFFMLK
jgi:hypothetical protein